MKTMMRHPLKLMAGILLAAVCTAAVASPFVGSMKDPHATLYLNVDQTARQIWPVKVWAVDGKLSNHSDSGVLYMHPGEYTLNVRAGRVNIADAPGLQRSASYGQDEHEIKIRLQAGKAYYIGAKFEASGKWQPVLWKTEDAKY